MSKITREYSLVEQFLRDLGQDPGHVIAVLIKPAEVKVTRHVLVDGAARLIGPNQIDVEIIKIPLFEE